MIPTEQDLAVNEWRMTQFEGATDEEYIQAWREAIFPDFDLDPDDVHPAYEDHR